MKSAGETASISLRKRPSVRRWMRARSPRSHHSPPEEPGVNEPRRTLPSASSRASARSRRRMGSPIARRVASAVIGPVTVIQPRTISTRASSASAGTRIPESGSSLGRERRGRERRAHPLHALGGDEARGTSRRSPRLARPAAINASSSTLPAGGGMLGKPAERQQRVVHLVGVARIRPGLAPHLGDRLGVERADAARQVGIGAAQRHGAGAALLERRVVEERVRVGVEDLVRHRRGRRRLDRRACGSRPPRCARAARAGRRRPSPRAGSCRASRSPADGRAARSVPGRLSPQASCAGNTAASRSSARMRWSAIGTRLPPLRRAAARARGWRSSASGW